MRAIRVSPLHDDFFDNYHFAEALMACLFSVCFCELDYTLSGILDELTPEEMEESFQKSIAERKKTETA